jgi:hypothetical protein
MDSEILHAFHRCRTRSLAASDIVLNHSSAQCSGASGSTLRCEVMVWRWRCRCAITSAPDGRWTHLDSGFPNNATVRQQKCGFQVTPSHRRRGRAVCWNRNGARQPHDKCTPGITDVNCFTPVRPRMTSRQCGGDGTRTGRLRVVAVEIASPDLPRIRLIEVQIAQPRQSVSRFQA